MFGCSGVLEDGPRMTENRVVHLPKSPSLDSESDIAYTYQAHSYAKATAVSFFQKIVKISGEYGQIAKV